MFYKSTQTMIKRIRKQLSLYLATAMILLTGMLITISCKDEYPYDDSEPEWLGASIYDYLKSHENYSYYVRLIDEVEDYKSVLSKTGSKTLFVADDAAFNEFFKSNPWNVSSYEDLDITQKKLILKFSMIDNAYLIETLANYYNGSLQEGTALRRLTSVSVLDSVPFESGDMLPKGRFWGGHRDKGIYLLKDASSWPMVHFLESSLKSAGISDADFSLITGEERSANDAHIFDIKVKERDITCKNGYIDVLEEVLIPPVNVAEYLKTNPNSGIFSELLDRFSAPYYNSAQTNDYNQIHPENPVDSIFEKIYFSDWQGAEFVTPTEVR